MHEQRSRADSRRAGDLEVVLSAMTFQRAEHTDPRHLNLALGTMVQVFPQTPEECESIAAWWRRNAICVDTPAGRYYHRRAILTAEALEARATELASATPCELCGRPVPGFVPSANVQLSAEASEAATLQVNAGPQVAVSACGVGVTVNGGGFVSRRKPPKTGAEWCEYYGIPVRDDGTVILFKALEEDWRGSHKTQVVYMPGSTPAAPDWIPGPECGYGLHFSPHPIAAKNFCPDATRFVGCPVRLDEIVVHPNGQYRDKVKAPRVVAPVFEVTMYGEPIGAAPPPVVADSKPEPRKRSRKKTEAA